MKRNGFAVGTVIALCVCGNWFVYRALGKWDNAAQSVLSLMKHIEEQSARQLELLKSVDDRLRELSSKCPAQNRVAELNVVKTQNSEPENVVGDNALDMYDKRSLRSGVPLRAEDLSEAERAFLEDFNAKARGTEFEIPEHAVFMRGLNGSLGAMTVTSLESNEPVELAATNQQWMEELVDARTKGTVLASLIDERIAREAVVLESREEAIRHAREDLKLERGYSVIGTRGGFIVQKTAETLKSEEIKAVNQRISDLETKQNVHAEVRWFRP